METHNGKDKTIQTSKDKTKQTTQITTEKATQTETPSGKYGLLLKVSSLILGSIRLIWTCCHRQSACSVSDGGECEEVGPQREYQLSSDDICDIY